MENIRIVERLPEAEELIALRGAAGWGVPERDAAAAALENTLFAVCAEEDGRCVGSGRVVGDGALVFYVHDLIVLSEYQRRGLGKKMMDAIRIIFKRMRNMARLSVCFPQEELNLGIAVTDLLNGR